MLLNFLNSPIFPIYNVEIPRPYFPRETREFERVKSDLSGRSSLPSKRKYAGEHGQ